MKKRIYDDEPFSPSTECTGCGPKDEPCVCQPVPDPKPHRDDDPGADVETNTTETTGKSTLEERRRDMEEFDHFFRETLLSILKSGKASPGHFKVAVAYLKDKGVTLPEMAKRERMVADKELLDDIDLPFGNA